ncbi:glutathione S-transferase [Lophiostoma macrostomum CBS 122681]|uniref:glutathione transferase n=1 Tax=Lophiostoma macrostomum CBS 122681 TaxID=1314788 RepID=A0A6A6TE82_9PLEO|nr:glutathione S-transferase [Lophiostoma macrostomum CBS 122681]
MAPTRPYIPKDVLVLYVPLMLLECLGIGHHVEVIDCKSDTWFANINPLRMVPAIEDVESPDGTRPTVFESSACLRYIAEKYDGKGDYRGRTGWERAQVSSWLAMHNAGLGSHAKWWLTLKRNEATDTNAALDIIMAAVKQQYSILDARLSEPNQKFIALGDRPSIADFATLAFANSQVAAVANIEFEQYKSLKDWAERMFALEGVKKAYERVQNFGVVDTCNCSKS